MSFFELRRFPTEQYTFPPELQYTTFLLSNTHSLLSYSTPLSYWAIPLPYRATHFPTEQYLFPPESWATQLPSWATLYPTQLRFIILIFACRRSTSAISITAFTGMSSPRIFLSPRWVYCWTSSLQSLFLTSCTVRVAELKKKSQLDIGGLRWWNLDVLMLDRKPSFRWQ